MIVVDASALVAILLDEPERPAFFDILGKSKVVLSPVGYWEAAIKLEHQRGPTGVGELDTLLSDFDIQILLQMPRHQERPSKLRGCSANGRSPNSTWVTASPMPWRKG